MSAHEMEALRVGIIVGLTAGGFIAWLVTYIWTRPAPKPMATRHTRHFFAN